MTPKQKAQELIGQFSKATYKMFRKTNSDFSPEDHHAELKKCALVAVDAIIELDICWYDVAPSPESTLEFWEEVKNELNQL